MTGTPIPHKTPVWLTADEIANVQDALEYRLEYLAGPYAVQDYEGEDIEEVRESTSEALAAVNDAARFLLGLE